MKSTSRLRVLSDRIPRVLVFVYFCRGLSGNTEERPTRRDYKEILTCRAIFYHLEDSRSHGNKAEAERAQGHGNKAETESARPTPLGARPPLLANQHESRGLCSTDSKDRGKSHDEGRFDRMVENNVGIPWELLFLDFLRTTLPRFLGGYSSWTI